MPDLAQEEADRAAAQEEADRAAAERAIKADTIDAPKEEQPEEEEIYVPEEAGDEDLGLALRAALTARPIALGEAQLRAHGPRMRRRASQMPDGPVTVLDSADEGGHATQPVEAPIEDAQDAQDAIQKAIAHANGSCRPASCEWCQIAAMADECGRWRAKAAAAPTAHELLNSGVPIRDNTETEPAVATATYAPPPSPGPPSPPAEPGRGLPTPGDNAQHGPGEDELENLALPDAALPLRPVVKAAPRPSSSRTTTSIFSIFPPAPALPPAPPAAATTPRELQRHRSREREAGGSGARQRRPHEQQSRPSRPGSGRGSTGHSPDRDARRPRQSSARERDRRRSMSISPSPSSTSPSPSADEEHRDRRRPRARAASDADWPARKRRAAEAHHRRSDSRSRAARSSRRQSASSQRRRRGTDRRRDHHRRSPTRVEITVRQTDATALQLRSPETLARQVLDEVGRDVAADLGSAEVAPWKQPAGSRAAGRLTATEADTEAGPGGSNNPDDWPGLWEASEARLEPLSRALAATLRHDKSINGCLTLEESQLLAGGDCGAPWSIADVLLTAVMSTRSRGLARFQLYVDDAGEQTIEAIPRSPSATPATRRAAAHGTTPATKQQLDAELDGWKMESRPSAPASSSRGPPSGVLTKMKRARGSRGNPNRPSQVARAARIAAEK